MLLKILHRHTPSIKLAIAILLIIAAACADEKVASRSYPVMNTYDVTDIDEQGATFNGEILALADGVTDHGFIYGRGNVTALSASYLDSISLGVANKTGKFSMLANRNLEKGKTFYVRAFARAASGKIVLGQETSFVSQGGAPPKIVDFNPKQGSVGDTVVIVGSGFSSHMDFDAVSFNHVSATITKATIDSLWVIIPLPASQADSTINVEVGGQRSEATQKFTLLKPSVVSFEPSLVTYGDSVTLHGVNFPLNGLGVSVSVFQRVATVVSSTRTTIVAVLAMDAEVSSSVITLSVGTQSVASQSPISLQTPIINGFTPTKGTNGTQVILNGRYFHPDKTKDKLMLGSYPVTISGATLQTLTVNLPSGIPPGSYPFSIQTLDLTSTSVNKFEIVKPVITSIAPLNGTWGTSVTIVGENFGSRPGYNIVYFGSSERATVVSASPTELTVLVPLYAPVSSLITVRATTTDNLSVTFPTPFLLDKPEITSFAPAEGKSGALVTISGKNFYPTRYGNVVTFGGKTHEIVSASSTQLVVRLTSLVDTSDFISVTSDQQQVVSNAMFHLISP